MFNESEARQYILQQHNRAYAELTKVFSRLQAKSVELPTFTIVDCVYRHCGQYSLAKHDIQYSLPFCVLAGATYWETVAHEMVHAFQRKLEYGDCNVAHGKSFLWLMAEIGFDTSNPREVIYHHHSILEAEIIAERLKKDRGGYSNHVSMQSRQRKSLRQLMEERNMSQ